MLMKSLGAQVMLTDGSKGHRRRDPEGRGYHRRPILTKSTGSPNEFENPANPAIHEQTTGPEIWTDTDGGIDILVSGVGTGGTLTGISRYIKNTRGKSILSVAVEPDTTTS